MIEGTKLYLMMGLPRSGKSTYAKEFARNIGASIVNPDAIRLALHGQRYQAEAEPMVWAMAKYMVQSLFLAGNRKVIIDATNTTAERRAFWAEIAEMTAVCMVSTPWMFASKER